jgi:hypothetical protein
MSDALSDLVTYGFLTEAVECIYSTTGVRHAVRHPYDREQRRTYCGRDVDHIGTETMNPRTITCVPCLKSLQLRGLLTGPTWKADAEAAFPAPASSLRDAAQAVVDAYDKVVDDHSVSALFDAIGQLRKAL